MAARRQNMIFLALPRQFANSSCFELRTYDVAGSIDAYNFVRQFKTLPAVVCIYIDVMMKQVWS
jgi:hypothetical protein